jgi:O-acetylserine/cysteine efflux transporter
LIFTAFVGVLIIFFDPKLVDNFLGLFFASLMALAFGLLKFFQDS